MSARIISVTNQKGAITIVEEDEVVVKVSSIEI